MHDSSGAKLLFSQLRTAAVQCVGNKAWMIGLWNGAMGPLGFIGYRCHAFWAYITTLFCVAGLFPYVSSRWRI